MRLLLISLQSNAYVTGLKYIAANVWANGHDARILLLPGYFERILAPAMEDFILRTIEPTVYFFITTRALDYNISWTMRTVLGNWRYAISKLLYTYLGKQDMKYGERLALLKKAKHSSFVKN